MLQSATAHKQNRVHLDVLQPSCPPATVAATSGIGSDLVATVSVVRDLAIYLDSDTPMTPCLSASSFYATYVVSAVLHVSRPILQSMVISLVLSRLDFGNAILTRAPAYVMEQIQSVLNAAARLIFSSSRFDHISRCSAGFTGSRLLSRSPTRSLF